MQKIAFIICANNALCYDECVRYLSDLEVPDGFEKDIICIQEASSMAEGYNAGMNATDAKYKVYMHQDVFILNKRFIYDVINIFEKDRSIGMIGMVGGRELPQDANCYLKWKIGAVEAHDGFWRNDSDYLYQSADNAYIPVMAIDGMLMVTQYDVPWREDYFDGWDFYDISQSIEMRKCGYQVVVPYQKTAWCYHDCGCSKLDKYDYYRKQIQECYPEYFKEEIDEKEASEKIEEIKKIQAIREEMIGLFEKKAYQELVQISEVAKEREILDTQIREMANLMEIYELEEKSIPQAHSAWYFYDKWEDVHEIYKWVGYVLRRLEYDRVDERIVELKELVENGQISKNAIQKIAANTIRKPVKYYSYFDFGAKLKEKPLVSVIISVHNGEAFVSRTVESVLQQTYRELEVIIVDDASTDKSRQIIEGYALSDKRIRTIYLDKNVHYCTAGNKALKFATGKYVAIIGHDDLWEADKLEKQVIFLEEHPQYMACFTWADIIDENEKNINGREYITYSKFCTYNLNRQNTIRKLLEKKNYFCAPSVCIRKSCLEKVGFYRYALVQLQDYELWLRVLRRGPVYILQEKLVSYRRFGGEKNLSAAIQPIYNRDMHETQWIIENYISTMSDKEFLTVFGSNLKNATSSTSDEILCEKAFLLWKLGNCAAEKWFIELMEEKRFRKLFEEKYQYTLLDFYKQNTEPMYFDKS